MKNIKKFWSGVLAMLTVLSLTANLAGCNNKNVGGTTEAGGDTNVSGATEVETKTYTVTLKTMGGMAMSGIDVYVYSDEKLTDLKDYGQTDESGAVSFSLPVSDDYVISLSGVPKGYKVENSYEFTGNTAAITLVSSLVKDESLSGAVLGVGDVMYDFSVTTPGGETITLSEMLKEKKMVLLNFWYTTCTWCLTEFPIMDEAYGQYSDEVGIIALDPLDPEAEIASFQAQNALSFPMASCPAAWSSTFGISGYPTSVVIDRYGVICLIEAGAITSLRPFTNLFDHFTAENYQQTLYGSLSELVTNVKPTYTMDSSETVGEVLNRGEIDVTYRPETEDESAEYSWPFIITEKNGETCLKASNQEIENSYAILYADVYLKAGQAVGFDYLASSEKGCDIMYVIVNDEDVFAISGVDAVETWKACYPWVAEKDGYYEVALCYLKDSSENEGDDTVYIKEMRVVDADEIEAVTYLPRNAATLTEGLEYEYVDVFFNERDGYYHVGSEDGPLLLADLMGYTQFNEERTVWDLAYNGDVDMNGVYFYDLIVDYCSYASNSQLSGVCTVNKELAELLRQVAEVTGFEEDPREWLKICKYFEVYGPEEVQLSDPIAGLAAFSAYEATLGSNVETNYFYYDRPIMPRGLMAKFVPERSGVYRITSRSESEQGVEGWIFGEGHTELYVYEQDERLNNDSLNVSMLYYMEAGETYYIDIAFWDIYEIGYIYYDIEYVAEEYEVFRLAAPGYFTYDTNATGEDMYHLIAGGIDVVLGSDGKYYEDLGKDADGNQRYGSLLYADFTGITTLFDTPIATVPSYNEDGSFELDAEGNQVMIRGIIDKGGFDFSKTEYDQYIVSLLQARNYDVEVTDAYLKTLWGEDYETNAEIYQIEDVFEGIYHGRGADCTEEMKAYLEQMITSGNEEQIGCVVVTERLAELLQMLMDKYTFSGVDHSWTKLCYYYDYLGAKR